MTREPSRAFGCAAALGIAAALPGIGYVIFHVVDVLAHTVHASDLLLLLAIGGSGPLLVLATTARMMRRADRPVALFVVSLVLTSIPTLLLAGLATFGSDGGPVLLACLFALICAAAAAVTAIAAAVDQRRG